MLNFKNLYRCPQWSQLGALCAGQSARQQVQWSWVNLPAVTTCVFRRVLRLRRACLLRACRRSTCHGLFTSSLHPVVIYRPEPVYVPPQSFAASGCPRGLAIRHG